MMAILLMDIIYLSANRAFSHWPILFHLIHLVFYCLVNYNSIFSEKKQPKGHGTRSSKLFFLIEAQTNQLHNDKILKMLVDVLIATNGLLNFQNVFLSTKILMHSKFASISFRQFTTTMPKFILQSILSSKTFNIT